MTQRILLVSNSYQHQAVLEEAVQAEDGTIVEQIKTSTIATKMRLIRHYVNWPWNLTSAWLKWLRA